MSENNNYVYTATTQTPSFAETGELIIALLDRELMRILPTGREDKERIIDFLYQWYYGHRLYQILMPDSLLKTTEMIFQDEVLRDFILNLTKQVQINLSNWNGTIIQLRSVLASGLYFEPEDNKSNDTCLIPQPIQEQLRIEYDYCDTLLKQNHWLLVLVMVYLFFHLSDAYAFQADSPET
jgi:hypothetical protein